MVELNEGLVSAANDGVVAVVDAPACVGAVDGLGGELSSTTTVAPNSASFVSGVFGGF